MNTFGSESIKIHRACFSSKNDLWDTPNLQIIINKGTDEHTRARPVANTCVKFAILLDLQQSILVPRLRWEDFGLVQLVCCFVDCCWRDSREDWWWLALLPFQHLFAGLSVFAEKESGATRNSSIRIIIRIPLL